MKTLILSNWSSRIAELNDLTEPNKAAYARMHDYEFENVKMPYSDESHVNWLHYLLEKLNEFDIVMTMGCDVLVMNQSIKIDDQFPFAGSPTSPIGRDGRVILAKDLTCCWPIQINNDVMIWPSGTKAIELIRKLIDDAPIWLKYQQLWQTHLWNLIQGEFRHRVRLVEPRLINSTFQPMTRSIDTAEDGTKSSRLTRSPGASSYALGDWIFHALDMPLPDKIQVIKWALQYVGDGSWKPDIDTRGTLV